MPAISRPTRSAPCERFSRLLWCFARPGPGTKEMSASSSRPHQWPASTFRPGRLALCGRCFASPQGSLARPRPGSRPRMTRRPSSALLGVPSASILRVGAARQMLGHQRPDRSRPGDLEGGEELPLDRTPAPPRRGRYVASHSSASLRVTGLHFNNITKLGYCCSILVKLLTANPCGKPPTASRLESP
jgi:hypothetical protein